MDPRKSKSSTSGLSLSSSILELRTRNENQSSSGSSHKSGRIKMKNESKTGKELLEIGGSGKRNKGVEARMFRDSEEKEKVGKKHHHSTIQAKLAEKAERYRRIKSGKLKLSASELEESLVDFDAEPPLSDPNNSSHSSESESESGSGSEYEDLPPEMDEFGREIREGDGSGVKQRKRKRKGENNEKLIPQVDEENVYRGDFDYQHVFEPNWEKQERIKAKENEAKEVHYEDTGERKKGASHINLGTGKEREQRIRELMEASKETEKARASNMAAKEQADERTRKRQQLLAERKSKRAKLGGSD